MIIVSENGRKNNCVISKLVYVHEGLKPVSIINAGTEEEKASKRWELINPYYFCRVCKGKENDLFWEEIFNWINNHYDLAKIKKISSIGALITDNKKEFAIEGMNLWKM